MDPWILLFDLTLLGVFFGVYRSGKSRRQLSLPTGSARLQLARTNLKDASETLGYELEVDGISVRAVGAHEGCEVAIEPLGILYETNTKDPVDTQIVLQCPKRLDGRVWLGPNASNWGHSDRGPQFRVGDPVFDQLYAVLGPESEVRARLGAESRGALIGQPGHFTLQGDRLCYATTALFEGPRAIVTAVNEALCGLDALRIPTDIPGALAEIVANDPEQDVRNEAFECLVTVYPDEDITRRTCQTSLNDKDPKVRLLASGPIATEAAGVLLELALSPHAETLRLQATEILGERLASKDALPRLSAILDSSCQTVAANAARVIGANLPQDGLHILMDRMPKAKRRVAVQIALALGDAEDVRAQPVLEQALKSPFAEVREVTAGALSTVGNRSAIPMLHDALQKESEAGVRQRLEWAINEVHSRFPAESGRLSLVAPSSSGQLAVVHTTGALSVPDE